MRRSFLLPVALASLLLTSACTYDLATGYAPQGYPPGYDSGMGSGLVTQPGDLFGGQNVASVAAFDAPLAPYGQWLNSRYGRAFRPDVTPDWRPYVNGRWGENRLWVSDDPWGWATDHYGRWGFDDAMGWVWVPGTEWAPSWVAFRDDPAQNVSGWAPIPPNVNYSLAFGFGSGWGYDSFSSWYGPSWVWVPRSYLYQPGFGGRVLPWSYGANYWGGSRWQYQPGWGGRPNSRPIPAYRPPGGNLPRRPVDGNWQGRPVDGNWRDRPQDGDWQGRPQEGNWQGRPRQGRGRAPGQEWNGQPRYSGGTPRPDRGQGQPADGAVAIPGFRPWQGNAGTRPAMPRADAPRPVASAEAQRFSPPPRAEQPRSEAPRAERASSSPRASRNGEGSSYERPK